MEVVLKIFHTADLHLGMTFRNRNYPEQVRNNLVEARFETMAGLVERANRENCHLFLVAGDLFHRANVSQKVILRALEILSRFAGSCVALLPGNHDYWDEFSPLWKSVQQNAFDNLVLLSQAVPYHLGDYDLDLVLYPAPCDRKHSHTGRVAWISALGERPPARWHLGVAHGAVRGISPDFEGHYFPVEEEELAAMRLHHWCLGHTHMRYPDADTSRGTVFSICGTPEPDGFSCSHDGYARIITLDEGGDVESRTFTTGRFRFREAKRELKSLDELVALKDEFVSSADGRAEDTLLKLALSGFLSREEYTARKAVLEELHKALAYMELDEEELSIDISPDTIAEEFARDSFPYMLLSRLAGKGEEEALQLAYRLIKKVKK